MNPHVSRLAETRAKARGLRGVNVEVAAFEDLGGDADAPGPYGGLGNAGCERHSRRPVP